MSAFVPAARPIGSAQDLSQNQHIEGLPLGTIGGLHVRHFFPVDGESDFQTKLYRTNLNIVRGLEYPNDFEVAIDGRPVHHVTIGGRRIWRRCSRNRPTPATPSKRGCA